MPFHREKYVSDWDAISIAVREAAGNRCEKCGVTNGAIIFRSVCGKYWYDPAQDCYFEYPSGERAPDWFEAEMRDKFTKVILTVAHLDATGDICQCEELTGMKCGDIEHLRSWCQACHLIYDGPRHVRNRQRNAMAQRAVGDLFEVSA